MSNDQSGPAAGIGARLRRRRRALHLTLKAVAEQAGLTEGYLSQVERDQVNASVRTLQRLCDVLKLSVGDLFEQASSAASRCCGSVTRTACRSATAPRRSS